jgi:hypothetical protein
VGDSSQRRDCYGSSKVAVSDRTTLGALSQFVVNDWDRVSGKRLESRESGEMSEWSIEHAWKAIRSRSLSDTETPRCAIDATTYHLEMLLDVTP